MKDVLSGFKEFIMRGSVIDLAIGVVIGTAFTAIVTSFVENFISPLIAMLFGKPDFSQALILTINNAEFKFGAILTDLISFLSVAAAVYFCIVLPLNKLAERRKKNGVVEEEETALVPDDVAVLREIRDLLKAQKND